MPSEVSLRHSINMSVSSNQLDFNSTQNSKNLLSVTNFSNNYTHEVYTTLGSESSHQLLNELQTPVIKTLIEEELNKSKIDSEAIKAKAALTKEEVNSIQWYTSVGYQYLNAELRKGEPLVSFFRHHLVNILNGMNKLEPFNGTVYRSIAVNNLSYLAEKLSPGQLVTDKGLISTSGSAMFAKTFRGEKGRVFYAINGVTTGRNIAGYTQLKQAEVLLPPCHHMRVKASKLTDKNLYVVLESTNKFNKRESVRDMALGTFLEVAISDEKTTVSSSTQNETEISNEPIEQSNALTFDKSLAPYSVIEFIYNICEIAMFNEAPAGKRLLNQLESNEYDVGRQIAKLMHTLPETGEKVAGIYLDILRNLFEVGVLNEEEVIELLFPPENFLFPRLGTAIVSVWNTDAATKFVDLLGLLPKKAVVKKLNEKISDIDQFMIILQNEMDFHKRTKNSVLNATGIKNVCSLFKKGFIPQNRQLYKMAKKFSKEFSQSLTSTTTRLFHELQKMLPDLSMRMIEEMEIKDHHEKLMSKVREEHQAEF